ncbi:hypothetical protein [Mycolicibacterium flavescens]|nr:hypothetical protein [Mycolicibacterium flavescens]
MPATTELTERTRAGLVTYAAGDALGVPWEGVDLPRLPSLRRSLG